MSVTNRICHICETITGARDSCPTCIAAFPNRRNADEMTGDDRAAEMELLCGVLEIPFDLLHQRIEELVGRPVWTHEMGSQWVPSLIEEARTRKRTSMGGVLDRALSFGKPTEHHRAGRHPCVGPTARRLAHRQPGRRRAGADRPRAGIGPVGCAAPVARPADRAAAGDGMQMMSWSTVRAEPTTNSGQRPYGPTVHEAVLTFRREYRLPSHATPEGIPAWVDAESAKNAFRALVISGWKDTHEPRTDWFETRLTTCERLEPTPQESGATCKEDRSDRWLIRVERPYDD